MTEKSAIVIPVRIPPAIRMSVVIITKSPLYLRKSSLLWWLLMLSPTYENPKTAHKKSGKWIQDKINVSLLLSAGNRFMKIKAIKNATPANTIFFVERLFLQIK